MIPHTGQTSTVALGFYAGGAYLAPSSLNDICESQYHVRYPPYLGQTCPSDWQVIDKAALRGALPWYKTVDSSSVDSWEEDIGALVAWGTAATDTIIIELKGEYEFKEPMDPTSVGDQLKAVGLEARKVRDARMREKLLKLLATSPSPSPSAMTRPSQEVVKSKTSVN